MERSLVLQLRCVAGTSGCWVFWFYWVLGQTTALQALAWGEMHGEDSQHNIPLMDDRERLCPSFPLVLLQHLEMQNITLLHTALEGCPD